MLSDALLTILVFLQGGEVKHRYDSLLNGFSATIPDNVLASFQSLQGDVIDYIGMSLPIISSSQQYLTPVVEPDQVVTINDQ